MTAPNSSLPEYFTNPKADDNVIQWMTDMKEALAIAWDALETIIANPSQRCTSEHDIPAQDAMRRIAELGK